MMFRYLLFWWALLVSAATEAQVRISVSPLASLPVNSAGTVSVPLANVAAVKAPAPIRKALAGMTVEIDTDALKQHMLTRESIEHQVTAWLSRHAPGETLQVEGPASVRLKLFRQQIPATEIVAIAREKLDNTLQGLYPTYAATLVSRLEDVRLEQDGKWDLQVDGDTPVRSRTVMRVSVLQHGKTQATVPVWFRVRAQDEVWVLQQSASEGTQLSGVTLVRDRVDVLSLSSEPLRNEQELLGKVFAVPVVEGQVLVRSLVRDAPLVDVGEVVMVNVIQGRVRIQATAEALQPGMKGQTIRLRSMSSREEFLGNVVAPGEIWVGDLQANRGEMK